jgi:tetratricopeptide (TPR) repeat protein
MTSRAERWLGAVVICGLASAVTMHFASDRTASEAVPLRDEERALLASIAGSRSATRPPAASVEDFFQRQLIERSLSLVVGADPVEVPAETGDTIAIAPTDHLAADTFASIRGLRPEQRTRVAAALRAYTRGRIAFEDDRIGEALREAAAAEAEFSAARVPLAFLARDLRIRAECTQRHSQCLEEIRAFRTELAASGRYPWLGARAAYAEGQTLHRRARVFEAVQSFQHAQNEFRRLQDSASEGLMHGMLANAYAVAGETDRALSHYTQAINIRTPQMGDRRRRQLEDAVTFLLRHGYLTAAEVVLDEEMHAAPATDSARVAESTLRGVLYMRHGDTTRGTFNFDHAHALLPRVVDPAVREAMAMFLAICEAGSRQNSPHPVLERINAAIAARDASQDAIWLPQLLGERGAELERRNDPAGAERDYRRAMDLLEQREPAIDQMLIGIGAAPESESPFDRAIRLLLRQSRVAEALRIAQRAAALRVSVLYAPAAGLRDVFRPAREPVDGNSVAEMQQRRSAGQVAVAYHLLRDELVTWVVTRTRIFAVRRRVPLADLVRRTEALRDCARRGCTDAVAVESVSELLLRDWIERVPRETTLLIQPPGEFQGVPFAMLRTRGNELLLTRNAIATMPTFRAFLRAEASDALRAGATGAYFAAAPRPGGDLEPLPLAEREVTRAARFYPGATVDRAATRASFLAHSSSFGFVHFAGHVLVNEQQPLLSAFAFQNSELLYVHELDAHAFANARLVVLSACETGRAPRPTMSVANALLNQNVPSVVYTLWPVSDAASQTFAVELHRVLASGLSRPDAVRAAQRTLMAHNPEGSDAWAAFAVAGAVGKQ